MANDLFVCFKLGQPWKEPRQVLYSVAWRFTFPSIGCGRHAKEFSFGKEEKERGRQEIQRNR